MARNSKGGWLLYCMIGVPWFWWVKIGITHISIGAAKRALSISDAFIGFAFPIMMSEKSEAVGEVRENMLWAVGSLEALAVVVHSGAFSRNGGQAYAAGMGIEYIWALSAVICLCSIGATIFYKKVIQ